MTTATDVLRYMRMNYRTNGRAQRQKILYYAQAWSLVWSGRPLFTDEVEAWPQGPVVPDAWRADQKVPADSAVPTDLPGQPLSEQDSCIVDAVVSFYGKWSGTDLINMTHEERPWQHAFHEVGGGYPCNQEVSLKEMRRFYTVKALREEDVPAKPIFDDTAQTAAQPNIEVHIANELTRWSDVNRILADR